MDAKNSKIIITNYTDSSNFYHKNNDPAGKSASLALTQLLKTIILPVLKFAIE